MLKNWAMHSYFPSFYCNLLQIHELVYNYVHAFSSPLEKITDRDMEPLELFITHTKLYKNYFCMNIEAEPYFSQFVNSRLKAGITFNVSKIAKKWRESSYFIYDTPKSRHPPLFQPQLSPLPTSLVTIKLNVNGAHATILLTNVHMMTTTVNQTNIGIILLAD